MNKKYQVFLSSTYEDLKVERDQVTKAILEMGHIPVGMEMFSAADEEQWQIIARHIETSDYYVVVVAQRYGSIGADGLSFTEKEYDYAIACGVPVLGFILSDSAQWSLDKVEKEAKNRESLERFKSKVKSRYVSFWASSDDLYRRVSVALSKQILARPRIGWVRADQTISPEIATELVRLSKENSELRARVSSLDRSLPMQDTSAHWKEFFDLLPRLLAASEEFSELNLAQDERRRKARDLGYNDLIKIKGVLARLDIDATGTSTEDFVTQAYGLIEEFPWDSNASNKINDFRRTVAKRLRAAFISISPSNQGPQADG
jgi:hypothetical protein